MQKKLLIPLLALVFVFGMLGAAWAEVNTTVTDFRVTLDRNTVQTGHYVNGVIEVLDENGKVDVFAGSLGEDIEVKILSAVGGEINYNTFAENGDEVKLEAGKAAFNINYTSPGTDTIRASVIITSPDGKETLVLGPKDYPVTITQAPNDATSLKVEVVDEEPIAANSAFTLYIRAYKGVNTTDNQNSEVTVKFVGTSKLDSDDNAVWDFGEDEPEPITLTGTMKNGVLTLNVPEGTLTEAGKYDIEASTPSPNADDGVAKGTSTVDIRALGPAKVSALVTPRYLNDTTNGDNVPTLIVYVLDEFWNRANTSLVTTDVEVGIETTNGVLLGEPGNTDTTDTVTVEADYNSATYDNFSVATGDDAPETSPTTLMGKSTLSITSADYEVETPELELTIYKYKLVGDYVATQAYKAGAVLEDSIRVGYAADGNSTYSSIDDVFDYTLTGFDGESSSEEAYTDNADGVTSVDLDDDNPLTGDNGQIEGTYWVVFDDAQDGNNAVDHVYIYDDDENQLASADNVATNATTVTLNDGDNDRVVLGVDSDVLAAADAAGSDDQVTKIVISTKLKGKQVKVDLYNGSELVDSITTMVGTDGLVSLRFTKALAADEDDLDTGDVDESQDEYFKLTYADPDGRGFQPGKTSDANITVSPSDVNAVKVYNEDGDEIDSIEISKSGEVWKDTIYGSEAGEAPYVALVDAYGNKITSGTIYVASDADPLNPDISNESFELNKSSTLTYDEAGTDVLTFTTDTPGVQSATLNVTTVAPQEPPQLATLEVLPASEYMLANGEIPVVVKAFDGDGKPFDAKNLLVEISDPNLVNLYKHDRKTEIKNGANDVSVFEETVWSLQAGNTPGEVTLTVRTQDGSVSESATVEIVESLGDIPAAVAAVTPASATLDMVYEQEASMVFTVTDADGNPLEGKSVTFTSDNEAVVTVTSSAVTDDNGQVTATITAGTQEGSAHVTATCEGVSGTVTVSVAEEIPSTPVGGEPGQVEETVNTSETYTMRLNITNTQGHTPEDIAQEWLVFGASVGGVDAGVFFWTTDGQIMDFETANQDPAAATFDFDHSSEVVDIVTMVLGDLGLSSGDLLWYGYAYSTTPVLDFTTAPNIVFENVVYLTIE